MLFKVVETPLNPTQRKPNANSKYIMMHINMLQFLLYLSQHQRVAVDYLAQSGPIRAVRPSASA